MGRYFFNLYECGTLIPDEEGRECDFVSLREKAVRDARDIMSAEVKKGQLCISCWVEVIDAAGNLVLAVPFSEALEITSG
ncbi:MAG: hypothetical protein M3N39_09840 [Pseudomonadota bacterium]|nr:hypothetical protein [Pseudomonadota bacterium]